MRWRICARRSPESGCVETKSAAVVLAIVARYFFHLHECGTLLSDEEGQELADAGAARNQAMKEARSVMSSEVQAGKLCLSCCIEVVDEAQRPVLTLPFKEALEVSGL